MPLPGNLQTILLTGHYEDFKGNDVAGSVEITPGTVLIDSAADVILAPFKITVPLVAGAFEVELPVTDDPDGNPTGFTYTLKELFTGGRTWSFELPASLGTEVDIADLPQAVPSSGSTLIPASQVTVTPFDGIIATRVQAALEEIRAEAALLEDAVGPSDEPTAPIGTDYPGDGEEYVRPGHSHPYGDALELLLDPPRCKVYYAGAAQNLPSTVNTIITWNQEEYDTAGMHSAGDPTKLIVQPGQDGLWDLKAALASATPLNADRFIVEILLNGVTPRGGRHEIYVLNTYAAACIAVEVDLVAGDELQVRCYINGGPDGVMETGLSTFSARLVVPA